MAVRANHSAPPRPGSGADRLVGRGIAVLLLVVPLGVWLFMNSMPQSAPSTDSVAIGTLNPQTIFDDGSSRFLPTPVAALPAEVNTGPPSPAEDEQTAADTPSEHVKIANTGGVGAILRADPPKGRQVAALRDGTVLQVLEHRQVDDGADWLRVRTPDGVEGWVFSRLVAASD
jgi:hypothetical protein